MKKVITLFIIIILAGQVALADNITKKRVVSEQELRILEELNAELQEDYEKAKKQKKKKRRNGCWYIDYKNIFDCRT